ncbi:hypothetical protein FNF28_04104 [Cafeteria roenbergensis]|uniref:Potassium channel domain-containing protein n=1 Tax=Cafeteria roenbergensis TaxID=33653 RepID=A0A5A8DE05_CAFRO|nr:hypothetical protein FNF28_04104 [Cafeteria roenbergensis]
MGFAGNASLDDVADLAELPPADAASPFRQADARLRARWFLARSGVGAVIELTNIALSAIACLLYTVHTYVREAVPEELVIADAFLHSFFLLHLLLHLVLAPRMTQQISSVWFWVNLVSILPLVFVGVRSRPSLLAKLVRVCVSLRLLHGFQLVGYVKDDVQKQLVRLVVVIASLVYGAAALIEVVENDPGMHPTGVPLPESHIPRLSLPNSAYFIITTVTTVGFGDISPITAAGRLVVVVLIAVAFLTVPRETNRLVALLATQSVFGRQKYEPSPTTKHVIVCGAVGSVPSSGGAGPGGEPANSGTRQGLLRSTGGTSGIIAFVREFFNDDHGSSGRHLVILARGPPAPELTVVLAHPKHAVGITYLDGDVMTERDLARAAVADSSGVFILSNKLARDFDAEDSANILRALAVQRFAQQSAPQLFVQLLRPENRALFTMTMASVEQSDACSPGSSGGETKQGPLSHLRRRSRTGSLSQPPSGRQGSMRFLGAGAAEEAPDGGRVPCRDDTLSLCVQQMKASLLAKSCMCPGFATVLFNLVASDADDGSRPQFEADDEATSRPQGSNPGPSSWASTVDVLGDRRLEHSGTDERRASMMSHTGRVAPYTEPEAPGVGAATSSRRNLAAPSGWLEQYRQGASFEVYRIPLSAAFEGVRFEVAASLVMEELGIILFGLDIRPRELSSSRIILSPAGYPIPATAEERVQGLPHVVVLCRGQPGDLFDFVRPLRGSHLHSFPDIVILCPILPTADDWLKISAYPGVWVVVGSPMRAADLARAGTTAARCAVLFQQEGGAVSQSDTLQSDTLIDADAIVIYRLVRSIAPATEIVVELARLESVAFLNDEIADLSGRGDSMTERKAFSAGHVFTSSFVDVCLCQAFFNPHIIGIVEQLLGVGDRAAARAWHRSTSIVSRLGKPLPSHVYIMKAPRAMVGKKFSDVFRMLCASRGILPLGLRRHRSRHLVRGASATGEPTSAAMQRLARQSDSDDDAYSSDDSNGASSSVGSRTATGYASAQSTPPLRVAASGADQSAQHAGRGVVDARPPSAALFKAPLNALDAGSAFVVTNPPATTVLKATDSLFVLAAHSPELEIRHGDT